MSVTANQLIAGAFGLLNVYAVDESVPAPDALDALARLNRLIGGWALRTGTIPASARVVTPLIANRGSLALPYTIGTGGAINTPRPASRSRLTGAGLQLNAATPPVELPRDVLTDAQWQAIAVKDLTSSLFTAVYLDTTITAAGFSTVLLWPVPDNAVNSLVLYIDQPISAFADLTTGYTLPDGYEEALEYNLARRLQTPFGRTLDADAKQIAVNSLAAIGRSNLQMSDLANDCGHLGARGSGQGGYDIQTGNG